MNRLIRALALLLFSVGLLAQTTTPNLGLNTPVFNTAGWDVLMNANFTKIDALGGGTAVWPVLKAGVIKLVGVSDGCATFTATQLGSTGSSCGSGAGFTGSYTGNTTFTGNMHVTGSLTLDGLLLMGTNPFAVSDTIANEPVNLVGTTGIRTLGFDTTHGLTICNGTTCTAALGLINPMTNPNDLIIGGTAGTPAQLVTVNNSTLVTDLSGNVSWNLSTGTGSSMRAGSPAMTGNPTAPTQAALDNSTRLATTFYDDRAMNTREPALGNPGTNGFVLSSTTAGVRSWISASGGSMVYPGAGLPLSTGSAWSTSISLPTTPNGVGQNLTCTPSAGVCVPGFVLSGLAVDNSNPATLLVTNRSTYLNWTSGSALALPAIAGNFASNFAFVLKNSSGSTLTITPNAAAGDLINGVTTATVLNNFAKFVYQDSTTAPGHWYSLQFPTLAAFGSTCTNGLIWSTTTGIGCGATPIPTASITTPLTNSTAAIGSLTTSFALADHVHPITVFTGGDVTGTGGSSQVLTLATVNGSPAACGDATHSCTLTINGKGLVTAESNTVISGGGAPAFSAVTTGTSTVALLMGTGGSLGVTGTGTINATSLNTNTFPAAAGFTSGGIPCYSSTSAEASSALLAATGVMLGGGAGVCPTASATNLSFASNVLSVGSAGVAGGLTLNGATSGSAALVVTATGGTLQINAGTVTNPSIQGAGGISNTGFYFPTTTSGCWDAAGIMSSCFVGTGVRVADGNSFSWSQTTSANGGVGASLGIVGTSTTENMNPSSVMLMPQCKITVAVTLSTSATTICSWTLPNAVATWSWRCSIAYAISAGTTPTFGLGMTSSVAPTNETGYAQIYSTNTGTSTQGTATATTTSNTLILQGATTSTGTFQANTFGTIVQTATSGTFVITGILGGTTPAGTVAVGSACELY